MKLKLVLLAEASLTLLIISANVIDVATYKPVHQLVDSADEIDISSNDLFNSIDRVYDAAPHVANDLASHMNNSDVHFVNATIPANDQNASSTLVDYSSINFVDSAVQTEDFSAYTINNSATHTNYPVHSVNPTTDTSVHPALYFIKTAAATENSADYNINSATDYPAHSVNPAKRTHVHHGVDDFDEPDIHKHYTNYSDHHQVVGVRHHKRESITRTVTDIASFVVTLMGMSVRAIGELSYLITDVMADKVIKVGDSISMAGNNVQERESNNSPSVSVFSLGNRVLKDLQKK